jgi:hypothetical protein
LRLFRSWHALLAAAVTLSVAESGYAYCLTRTCDPTSGNCEFDGTCNISGQALFWPNSCVSFAIQKSGSSKLGIDYGAVHSVALRSFQQWTNADCGNGSHPDLQVADYGAVDCAKPEYNQNQPNANVITFHDATWPYANTADTVALTTVFFDPKTGEIYDANVELNSDQYSFSIGEGVGDQVDLNAVLTHESGHFLGLAHSEVLTATMFSRYNPDMATLDPDDEAAICASLPPDRPIVSASCTPRHGFSGECGKPETGCCATAVGANASSHQTLGLLAFGLGICAFTARQRLSIRHSRRPRWAPRR